MKKLQLIIRREFLAKVRNKSFLIMTFLSPLLVVGIAFLVFFLTKKNDNNVKKIAFVDASKLFSKDDFKDTKSYHYIDHTLLGIEESKKEVEKGGYYGVLHIPQIDSLEVLAKSIAFYSKAVSYTHLTLPTKRIV